ncbi:MAG TPA: hypothetical protein VIP30_07815 [Stenotrophomonas sp.]
MTRATRLHPVLWGGLLAGLFDFCYATGLWALKGVPPVRVWQAVASGLLGREAFAHGRATAALGIVLHFSITCVMAWAFWFGSRRMHWLREHPWRAGLAYGLWLYVAMNYIVLPLSAMPASHAAPTVGKIALDLLVHLVIGLIISMTVYRHDRLRPD